MVLHHSLRCHDLGGCAERLLMLNMAGLKMMGITCSHWKVFVLLVLQANFPTREKIVPGVNVALAFPKQRHPNFSR